MSYMVIYREHGADPAYSQFQALDEAAAYVEARSNETGLDEVHIFRLERIDFEIKPYYRVHLGHNPPALPARATATAPTSAGEDRTGWFEPNRAIVAEPEPDPVEIVEPPTPETAFEDLGPAESYRPWEDGEAGEESESVETHHDDEHDVSAGRRGLFGR